MSVFGDKTAAKAGKNDYWPGHVVAESLVDDNTDSGKSNVISRPRKDSNTGSRRKSDANNDSSKENVKINLENSFAAIVKSMLPYDVIDEIEKEASSGQDSKASSIKKGFVSRDEYYYDEFGFKVEKESEHSSKRTSGDRDSKDAEPDENVFVDVRLSNCPNSEKINRMLTEEIFKEDSKHKLKWIAYLEFTLNADIGASFSWDQVTTLNKCEKLKGMIRGQGVPHSLRPFIWMRSSGALQKKLTSSYTYAEILKKAEDDLSHASKQIEKDLLRTLPTNACFSSLHSVGVPRLRRILQSVAWLFTTIGYCQGMGTIVASLLLFLEEEDVFWLMCTIIEDILPFSYFSHTLIGVQADMKVLQQLINAYLPEIGNQFKTHDIELSLVCINWFLTIFSNVFHIRVILRVWDLFFYEGSSVLFQITLAILKLNEKQLVEAENSAQIFTILTEIPNQISNIDYLIETSIRVASSVNKNLIDSSRQKHQAYLMAQNGSIINPSNYQHLALNKEKPQLRIKQLEANKNSKTFLKLFRKTSAVARDQNNNSSDTNFNDATGPSSPNNKSSLVRSLTSNSSFVHDENSDLKMKNIIQTEFLVNLREVILKIAHQFQKLDADMYSNCDLNADYSIESHARDHQTYLDISKVRQFKRAKALIDFEKSDDDELGFHKNDIITVLSTKDDHCWIGEFNGQKGWFPSRFVCLIDERNGKIYSPAGDDSVNEYIRDLIRGEFTLVIKSLFEHGLKKWSVIGGASHPWTFIEEAAKKTVEKDFESVYSRLVLCKTFRLDEDGKILTPDELLFRSVQLINMSHDQFRAQADVKFRSLLCIGLNEQLLHIWLETLCSCLEVVEKWYHPWSFIRSPGWVQIKCELRVLAQFSFLLNPDAELPDNKKELAINESIKDMLVKHHLFSWDIN